MAGGGDHHRTFQIRGVAQYRTSGPPDDETTRYQLLPEFPFKTAKAIFSKAADQGAGDSAEIIAAPEPRRLLEDEDILTEILCRLPPLPAPLACAWLVSRQWARLGASAAFRRRLQGHHRKPPVLGVYGTNGKNLVFIPTLDAPNAIPPERFSLKVVADHASDWWNVLGCRQGRVLVVNRIRAELLVFEPVSGNLHLVAYPPYFVNQAWSANGAVVADEQQGELPSAFNVVLLGVSANGSVAGAVSARVYSSETRVWGDLVSTPERGRVGRLPCTLVGNGLYCWLAEPPGSILHFDLASHTLAVMDMPTVAGIFISCSRIIRGQDGGVGLAVLSYPTLQMYERKVAPDGITTWPLRKMVQMDDILGLAVMEERTFGTYIVGYSEEADAIVMSVYCDADHNDRYMVQLDSMEYKKLEGQLLEHAYHPFPSFYTGGPSVLQLPALVDNEGGAAVAEDVGGTTQYKDLHSAY